MKVIFKHRHYGVHQQIKEIIIEGNFADYVKKVKHGLDDYFLDEEKLINNLPDEFLPIKPNRILITLDDENGGTALCDLTIFRPWGKYFDSYVLSLDITTWNRSFNGTERRKIMGGKYEVRHFVGENFNYTTEYTNSFIKFIKILLIYRGRVIYFTVRP